MKGEPPGRVEKNSRFLAKGDHWPESSLRVRGDKELPFPSAVPSASSMMRLCEPCIDPAFSTMTWMRRSLRMLCASRAMSGIAQKSMDE
eukprot:9056321-Alexandrium_andersonii.AAC.1